MIRIIGSLRELNFEKLSAVYGLDQPDKRNACCEFYDYLRECFFNVKGAVYAVLEVDGEYVSALRAEPYRDGYLIEALETVPKARNMGYAKRLLQAVTAENGILNRLPVYAHIHKKNKASLAVHEACGFRRILEHAVFIDGSVYTHSCTVLKTV